MQYFTQNLAFCAVLAGICLPADAAAGPRFALLFEEMVEARPGGASTQTVLAQALLAGGMTMVDEAQSRRIRSVTTAGRLLQGGVSEVVTGLDADYLIVGVTRIDRVNSKLLKTRAIRMEAITEARLIAVSSGRVIAALNSGGTGLSMTPSEAARLAARDSGRGLAQQILSRVKKAGAPLELVIDGPFDLDRVDALTEEIEAMKEVQSTKLLHGGAQTKLEIRTAAPAETIARRLRGTLSVEGLTTRQIRARWSRGTPPGLRPKGVLATKKKRRSAVMPPAQAALERGRRAVYQRSYDEAEVAFREALKLDPGSEEARSNLAALPILRGDLQGAERAYDALRTAGVRNLDTSLNAALGAWAGGDRAAFAERITDALEIAQTDVEREKVARILRALGEGDHEQVEQLVVWR